MTEAPLVSVIIPTYNRPDFLRRAVASAQRQKGVQTDIIIVDDNSDTDLTDEFSGADNIRYIRNRENLGGSHSRNRGLELAKGRFVNFLDDDDEFLEDKLIRQVQKFSDSDVPNLAMVSCHIRDMRSGEEVILWNRYKGDIYRESLERYTVKLTTSMLFRTDVVRRLGGFDSKLQSSQEYDLIIRLSKSHGVDYVDEVLALANASSHQISLNFDKKSSGARRLFAKFDDEFREVGFLFRLKMRLKLRLLLFRFWMGKHFGKSAYQLFLLRKGI